MASDGMNPEDSRDDKIKRECSSCPCEETSVDSDAHGIKSGKLPLRTKISYGVGGISDHALYVLAGTYLLLYLTTVAGVNPAVAGTICAIGSIWEAVIGPIIGFTSDMTVSRFGKRKPFMLAAAVPIAVVTGMLFTTVGLGEGAKTVYYSVMIILFWTFFSMEFVPYLSWGADLTEDYHERTVLRSSSFIFNQVGTFVGMVLPTIIVERAMNFGMNLQQSWQIVGIVCGITVGAALLISAGTIHDDDRDPKSEAYLAEKARLREMKRASGGTLKRISVMFKEYFSILKLRPIQFLIGASMVYLVAETMFSSDRVFFMRYNMGMSRNEISAMMLLTTISGLVFVPVIERACRRTDKKNVFIACVALAGAVMIAMRFIGVEGLYGVIAVCIVYSMANTCYWQLMPSMTYDICEVEELESGASHSGAVISLQALSESICIAIGLQMLGIILEKSGFDETLPETAVQQESALYWVSNAFTFLPGALLLIAALVMIGYPITREKFEKIRAELEIRRSENL